MTATFSKRFFSPLLKTFISCFLCFCILFAEIVLAAPISSPASDLKISSKLGKIEEFEKGMPGSKTIYYIQDAHDSLEAQENIAKLVRFFVEKKGVHTVFEEGYEGPVPTDSYFGYIRDAKIREKVSYFLLDKLRLGGAEFEHVNRKKDFKLVGADSLKLHLKNIAAYRRHAKYQKQVQSDLNALLSEIQKLANLYFPKQLKEWIRLRERYDRGDLHLLDYLKRIGANEKSAISLVLTAEATRDVRLVKEIEKLDAKKLFEEMDQVETQFSASFLKNERDQKLFYYFRTLNLLKRLSEIEVTPSEYEAVKNSLKNFDTQSLADFIAKTSKKPILLSRRWERRIKSATAFYEIAQQRNEAVAKSLDAFLKNPDETNAVLVFGGFHAGDLKRFFKERGLSYAVISPRITKEDPIHRGYYKQLMAKGYHDFEMPFALSAAAKALPVLSLRNGRAEVRAIQEAVISVGNHQNWMRQVKEHLVRAEQRAVTKNFATRIESRGGTSIDDLAGMIGAEFEPEEIQAAEKILDQYIVNNEKIPLERLDDRKSRRVFNKLRALNIRLDKEVIQDLPDTEAFFALEVLKRALGQPAQFGEMKDLGGKPLERWQETMMRSRLNEESKYQSHFSGWILAASVTAFGGVTAFILWRLGVSLTYMNLVWAVPAAIYGSLYLHEGGHFMAQTIIHRIGLRNGIPKFKQSYIKMFSDDLRYAAYTVGIPSYPFGLTPNEQIWIYRAGPLVTLILGVLSALPLFWVQSSPFLFWLLAINSAFNLMIWLLMYEIQIYLPLNRFSDGSQVRNIKTIKKLMNLLVDLFSNDKVRQIHARQIVTATQIAAEIETRYKFKPFSSFEEQHENAPFLRSGNKIYWAVPETAWESLEFPPEIWPHTMFVSLEEQGLIFYHISGKLIPLPDNSNTFKFSGASYALYEILDFPTYLLGPELPINPARSEARMVSFDEGKPEKAYSPRNLAFILHAVGKFFALEVVLNKQNPFGNKNAIPSTAAILKQLEERRGGQVYVRRLHYPTALDIQDGKVIVHDSNPLETVMASLDDRFTQGEKSIVILDWKPFSTDAVTMPNPLRDENEKWQAELTLKGEMPAILNFDPRFELTGKLEILHKKSGQLFVVGPIKGLERNRNDFDTWVQTTGDKIWILQRRRNSPRTGKLWQGQLTLAQSGTSLSLKPFGWIKLPLEWPAGLLKVKDRFLYTLNWPQKSPDKFLRLDTLHAGAKSSLPALQSKSAISNKRSESRQQLKISNETELIQFFDQIQQEAFSSLATPPIIAVSGFPGSGKSVFTNLWAQHLRERGVDFVRIRIDAFLKPHLKKKSLKNIITTFFAWILFSLSSFLPISFQIMLTRRLGASIFDMQAIQEFSSAIHSGQFPIEIRLKSKRGKEASETLRIEKNTLVIIEGISSPKFFHPVTKAIFIREKPGIARAQIFEREKKNGEGWLNSFLKSRALISPGGILIGEQSAARSDYDLEITYRHPAPSFDLDGEPHLTPLQNLRSEMRSRQEINEMVKRGLTYDEAVEWRRLKVEDGIRLPRFFWTSEQTAKNMTLAALDTVEGFRDARLRKNVKKMAALYRKHVISYQSQFEGKDGGQQAFFFEVGGLKGMMSIKRPYLSKTGSPSMLLRLALPEIMDPADPNALNPLEVEKSYWSDPENGRYHILKALDSISGFETARKANDIQKMAELYRNAVLVGAGSQRALFNEKGGLSGLIGSAAQNIDYLPENITVSSLIRFAIPALIDQENPKALQPYEVEQGFWDDPEHAKYYILRALDTIEGFKAAREAGDIKTMANLYREKVISYQPKDSKKYPFGGQQSFFEEVGDLTSLIGPPKKPYFAKVKSASELVRLVLPNLIDANNPDALHPLEIENKYWTDSENIKNHVLKALDSIPGFQAARLKNDIPIMAQLYRDHVLHYEPLDKDKYSEGGQYTFLSEKGGMGGAKGKNNLQTEDGKSRPLSLLNLALPGLVDLKNPNALQPYEVEHGYWNNTENVQKHVLNALNTIPGFEKAHSENDIKTMAALYRQHVMDYEPQDRKKYIQGGQQTFFAEVGGLSTLMKIERDFLPRTGSAGSLISLTIPNLIDDANPEALRKDEVFRPERGRMPLPNSPRSETRTAEWNQWTAKQFSNRLKKGFESGSLSWESQFENWNAIESKDKIRGAGVVVIRKIKGQWSLLVGRKTRKDVKNKAHYAVPAGKIDKARDLKFETQADFEKLAALRLAIPSDRREEGETTLAGALRELKEEAGIKGKIAGRLDDYWDAKTKKLVHYFIYIDSNKTKAIAPHDKEFDHFKWVPLHILFNAKDGEEGKAIEKNIKGRLIPIYKKQIFPNLKEILQQVSVRAEGRPEQRLVMTPELAETLSSQVKIMATMSLPGAGKGTLLKRFLKDLNSHLQGKHYVYLEMGDWFRGIERIVKGEASENDKKLYSAVVPLVPKEALEAMSSGNLVNDETALQLLNAILELPYYRDAHGVILDGFPRNPAQFEFVEKQRVKRNDKDLNIDLNLILNIPEEIAIQRVLSRGEHAKKDGKDVRADDLNPEIVANRIRVASAKTQPLIKILRALPQTIEISTEKNEDDVYEDFLETLMAYLKTVGKTAAPRSEMRTEENNGKNGKDEIAYYAYYKPRNVLSAPAGTAWDDRKTIHQMMRNYTPHVNDFYVAGRLDVDVDGLVIFTNDGPFFSALFPSGHVEKQYEITVNGLFTEEQAERLRQGVSIDVRGERYTTLPANVKIIVASSVRSVIHLFIHEGKYHQVKEMFRAVGFSEIKLSRLAIGELKLSDLNLVPGEAIRLEGQILEKVLKVKQNAQEILEEKSLSMPHATIRMVFNILGNSHALAARDFGRRHLMQMAQKPQNRRWILETWAMDRRFDTTFDHSMSELILQMVSKYPDTLDSLINYVKQQRIPVREIEKELKSISNPAGKAARLLDHIFKMRDRPITETRRERIETSLRKIWARNSWGPVQSVILEYLHRKTPGLGNVILRFGVDKTSSYGPAAELLAASEIEKNVKGAQVIAFDVNLRNSAKPFQTDALILVDRDRRDFKRSSQKIELPQGLYVGETKNDSAVVSGIQFALSKQIPAQVQVIREFEALVRNKVPFVPQGIILFAGFNNVPHDHKGVAVTHIEKEKMPPFPIYIMTARIQPTSQTASSNRFPTSAEIDFLASQSDSFSILETHRNSILKGTNPPVSSASFPVWEELEKYYSRFNDWMDFFLRTLILEGAANLTDVENTLHWYFNSGEDIQVLDQQLRAQAIGENRVERAKKLWKYLRQRKFISNPFFMPASQKVSSSISWMNPWSSLFKPQFRHEWPENRKWLLPDKIEIENLAETWRHAWKGMSFDIEPDMPISGVLFRVEKGMFIRNFQSGDPTIREIWQGTFLKSVDRLLDGLWEKHFWRGSDKFFVKVSKNLDLKTIDVEIKIQDPKNVLLYREIENEADVQELLWQLGGTLKIEKIPHPDLEGALSSLTYHAAIPYEVSANRSETRDEFKQIKMELREKQKVIRKLNNDARIKREIDRPSLENAVLSYIADHPGIHAKEIVRAVYPGEVHGQFHDSSMRTILNHLIAEGKIISKQALIQYVVRTYVDPETGEVRELTGKRKASVYEIAPRSETRNFRPEDLEALSNRALQRLFAPYKKALLLEPLRSKSWVMRLLSSLIFSVKIFYFTWLFLAWNKRVEHFNDIFRKSISDRDRYRNQARQAVLFLLLKDLKDRKTDERTRAVVYQILQVLSQKVSGLDFYIDEIMRTSDSPLVWKQGESAHSAFDPKLFGGHESDALLPENYYFDLYENISSKPIGPSPVTKESFIRQIFKPRAELRNPEQAQAPNELVFAKFDDIAHRWSDGQVTELLYTAQGMSQNSKMIVTDLDVTHPMGKFLREQSSKIKSLEVTSAKFKDAAAKAARGFEGEVIVLSHKQESDAVTLKKAYNVVYEETGTLGVVLKDLRKGDLKKGPQADFLRIQDYYGNQGGRIFITDFAAAKTQDWQTIYTRNLAFSRAA